MRLRHHKIPEDMDQFLYSALDMWSLVCTFARSDLDSPRQSSPNHAPRGPARRFLVGHDTMIISTLPSCIPPGNVFRSSSVGVSAATTGQYRVASGIRIRLDIMGEKRIIIKIVGPGGTPEGAQNQYPAFRKGRASNALAPTMVEFDGTKTSS